MEECQVTLNRRTLLSAGLAVVAASARPRAARAASAMKRAAMEALPPVGGEANPGPNLIRLASGDFGHILRKPPRAVLKPSSAAEIAAAIGQARRQGLKVAPRGQGHSTYGRALAEDGLGIDMNALIAIHDIQQDRMIVDAGATWRAVLDASLAHGLTPPVLPNHLDLSVGGTLAVGGIGGTTSHHGMQTDQVLDLSVVTGDGRELTCSATAHADLFDAVRAGLGQCGVIVRTTLRLIRAPERARRYQLFYPSLGSLTADQRALLTERRFDHLQGAFLPAAADGWRFQLEAIRFYGDDGAPEDAALLSGLSDDRGAAVIADLTYAESQSAFAEVERVLRSNGQWFNPHPWWFTFLPGSNAEQVAGQILDELTREDVGQFGRLIYYPMFTGAVRTPLIRLPDEEIVFPFNIIRMLPSADTTKVERLIAANRSLYERVRAAGAVQYPVGAVPMSSADWQDHFGPLWPRLRNAKRDFDPSNILTPGYALL
jgi:cytokinin dehydrogenase